MLCRIVVLILVKLLFWRKCGAVCRQKRKRRRRPAINLRKPCLAESRDESKICRRIIKKVAASNLSLNLTIFVNKILNLSLLCPSNLTAYAKQSVKFDVVSRLNLNIRPQKRALILAKTRIWRPKVNFYLHSTCGICAKNIGIFCLMRAANLSFRALFGNFSA